MFRALCIALLLGIAGMGVPGRGAVVIDPKSAQGPWEGWGTSLCWWANVMGDRDDLADLLFTTKTVTELGQALPGLGLNIVRYNVGASGGGVVNGHSMVAAHSFPPFRQMQGYWLDGASEAPQSLGWNWDLDANQRAMMLKARQRGADRFEMFSNSPMWWMCKNACPSGGNRWGEDNLAPEHYHDFAVYLATVALYAKMRWGITFTSVEPFNEPGSGWWMADGKQEGCCFSPRAQAALLPLLRAELDKRGLRTMPIAASDENTYTGAIATWDAFGAGTRALVGKINVHGYEGMDGRRDVLAQMAAAAGRPLWNSEYGEHDGSGLSLAQCLSLDFQFLHPRAWCYWQPFDMGGWGLVATWVPGKTMLRINPKYYVLVQYTRHIRPGMIILSTGDPDTVAAWDKTGRKLALVIRNGPVASRKQIDLSRLGVNGGTYSRWITEPRGSTRYEAHPGEKLAGRVLDLALPPDSVQTVEIGNLWAE